MDAYDQQTTAMEYAMEGEVPKRQTLARLAPGRQNFPMSATLIEPLLSVREAARVLSVSTRTVYGLIESGQLPAFRVGGQLRLSRDALSAWLQEQATRRRSSA